MVVVVVVVVVVAAAFNALVQTRFCVDLSDPSSFITNMTGWKNSKHE